MQRIFQIRIYLLLFILLGLHLSAFSQDLTTRKTINDFLNVWLIKKDIGSVKKHLSKNIFANKFLFAETCIGESRQVKKASLDFLNGVSQSVYEKKLEDALVFNEFDYKFKPDELLSVPEKEKYLLVKVNSGSLLKITNNGKTDYFYQNLSYIKTNFYSKEYLFLVLLVKTKFNQEKIDVPLYLIWINENSKWKIIQFGMECQ